MPCGQRRTMPRHFAVFIVPHVVHYFVADKRKQSETDTSEQASLRQAGPSSLLSDRGGREPVREWLKSLPSREDPQTDRRRYQNRRVWLAGGNAGMPLCSPWHLRSAVRPGPKPHCAGTVLFRQEWPNGALTRLRRRLKKILGLARRNKKKHERSQ